MILKVLICAKNTVKTFFYAKGQRQFMPFRFQAEYWRLAMPYQTGFPPAVICLLGEGLGQIFLDEYQQNYEQKPPLLCRACAVFLKSALRIL